MKQKPTILIVDDEEFILDILESLLLLQGYMVESATNGVEALEKISSTLPDLILLDVMMPGLNGFQVCQHVKAHDQWRHVPIILVTALDGKEDLARGIDAGADDFLQKPFDNLELLARVRSMLRIKEQYDLLEQQRQQLQEAFLVNEKFARAMAQHLEELEVLHETGLHLMNNLDMDSVLQFISETSLEIIPEATRCVMHLLSPDGQELLPVVFSSPHNTKMVYPSLGFEDWVNQALETRQTVHITDLQTKRNSALPHFEEIRSLLIVPLSDDQQSLGTLTVLSPEINIFGQNHYHILAILANQAVVAIMKARFFEERRQAKEQEAYFIRQLFHRYVSPQVVDRLVAGKDQLSLGGKRQEISVLFADIRNFTSFSEYLAPEELVEVLNEYLALAVEAILDQEGTLDKFMGDAVMAFFNAPLTQTDHALRAVQAAWAMQQLIDRYNAQAPANQQLSFGIGIHVGYAVVGNIGTAEQMNYTAIGDTVNLAKRLQENAAGGQILLSHEAYELVKEWVNVRSLGYLAVKGRTGKVPIYELTSVFN